jgi:vesicle-associated membrane protein 7
MAIRYAIVARGSVILAEYSISSSNASLVARQILEKLPPGTDDTSLSYPQVQGVFHVTREDGLTFLCMADGTFGSKSLCLCLFQCI